MDSDALSTLRLVLGDSVASEEDLKALLKSHHGDPNQAANAAFERLSKGLPLVPPRAKSPEKANRPLQTPSSNATPFFKKQSGGGNAGTTLKGLQRATDASPTKKRKIAITSTTGESEDNLNEKSATSSSPSHSADSPASESPSSILDVMDFPRSIGDMMVVGYSLVTGPGHVSAGDALTFDRITQKISSSSSSSASPQARRFGKKKENTIVRVVRRGREIGRLASEPASFVSKLLDLDIVVLSGTMLDAPDSLKLMDNMIMTLEVKLPKHAFTYEPLDEEVQKQRIAALQATFDKIGKVPHQCSHHRVLLEERKDHAITTKSMVPPPSASVASTSSAPTQTVRGTDAGKDQEKGKHPLSSDIRLVEEEDAGNDDEDEGDGDGDSEDKVSEGHVDELALEELYRSANAVEADLKEADQPPTMTYSLRPYQRQALTWMLQRESLAKRGKGDVLHPLWEEHVFDHRSQERFYWNPFTGELRLDFPSAGNQIASGILADEMGLGKTVEVISLIHSNPYSMEGNGDHLLQETGEGKVNTAKRKGFSKATLVVCPMSLLGQWMTEIASSMKPGTLKILSYYGEERTKSQRSLADYDVIVTTYGVLCSDFDPTVVHQTTGLFSIEFHRVVLDEAHIIKSKSSLTARASCSLKAMKRWAVSGTPIQNKLEDLYSLLKFMKLDPWSNFSFWKTHIETPFDKRQTRASNTLAMILKQGMLRRTKDSKDSIGNPIIQLPPKDCKLEMLEFVPEEREFYKAVYQRAKVKFQDLYMRGSILRNYASVLAILLRLRQCCDHPRLLTESPNEEKGGEEALSPVTIDPTADCPFCLEPLGDLAVVTTCRHSFCYDCMIEYMKKNSGVVYCPLCRGQALRERDLVVIRQNGEGDPNKQKALITNYPPSTKVQALLKALKEVRSGDPTSKSIVFSQWTSMLDLLLEPLTSHGFKFLRLDGTVPQAKREEILSNFRNTDVSLLLVSLRAGGVGLNLTAANNCFLLDLWWNPAVEEQAIDRVHRIGQTKPVSVTRFVIKNTVEEKMLNLQSRKRQLAKAALSLDKEQQAQERLDDLVSLFSD